MIYMLKSKILLFLALITVFTSCGYRETSTQIRDVSFIKFNKSRFNSYTVVVNDTYKFQLSSCNNDKDTNECHDDTVDKLFEISSGNVVVKVLDENQNLIMEKSMYIGSSSTKEINLP